MDTSETKQPLPNAAGQDSATQVQGPSAEDSNAHVLAREDTRGVQEDIFVKLERPSTEQAEDTSCQPLHCCPGVPPPQKQKQRVCVSPARFPPDRPDTLDATSVPTLSVFGVTADSQMHGYGPSCVGLYTCFSLTASNCFCPSALVHQMHLRAVKEQVSHSGHAPAATSAGS